MHHTFHGWPADGLAFLTEIAADNSRDFWAAHHHRHTASVLGPMRALAAALEPEFGPLRVFRPQVNRRFRPDAPPYRTDSGAVTTATPGWAFGVVLSGTGLAASAGRWRFDRGQLRRYRTAVAGEPGEELAAVLASLPGFAPDEVDGLTGPPRGQRADHPRIGLLRRRGLQMTRRWAAGPWLDTAEPLDRVRAAWRAAAPLARWLDEHVGAPEPVPPRPRPPGDVPGPGPDGEAGVSEPASNPSRTPGGGPDRDRPAGAGAAP